MTVTCSEVRVALLAASHIAELTLARRAEEDAEAATAMPDTELTHQLTARRERARREAAAALQAALDPLWWDAATSESIDLAYQAVIVWGRTDRDLTRLADLFTEALHTRYAVRIPSTLSQPRAANGPSAGGSDGRRRRFGDTARVLGVEPGR